MKQRQPRRDIDIDSLDDVMVNFHGRIANQWQTKTRKYKDGLAAGLRYFSMGAFGVAAGADLSRTNFIGAGIDLFFAYTAHKENQLDPALRKIEPQYLSKALNLALYCMGVLETVRGTAQITYGVYTGDWDHIRRGFGGAGFGIGLVSSMAADYIERVNIDPPKRNGKDEKPADRNGLNELKIQPKRVEIDPLTLMHEELYSLVY